MARKKVFTLRYGESEERDVLVHFNEDETIVENLARIIPAAIGSGHLPPECSAQNCRLYYGGKLLNPNLTLKEQLPQVRDGEMLILRDQASTVRLMVRFKPDNEPERAQSVFVNPNRPLKEEMSKFLQGVGKDYRFYRRKAKKFRLYAGRKKLKLGKSLAAQGFESGFDARLVPALILRWPPGTALIMLFCLILAAGLGYGVWRIAKATRKMEVFQVRFTSDDPCWIVGDGAKYQVETSGQTVPLKAGFYKFEVLPKSFPIFPYDLEVGPKKARKDSLYARIPVHARFAQADSILLVITGYQGEELSTKNRINGGLLINGFPRDIDEYGYLKIMLPRGMYEIRYSLPDSLLDVGKTFVDPLVPRPTWTRFDFSAAKRDTSYITFVYRKGD